MKTLNEVQLENLIWMRELMLAGKRDTTQIDIDIKLMRLKVAEAKWKETV